jgi:glycosyltransferase involved in cell wall biosynthesis
LHDFNCGFKAYTKEVLSEIDVYGDLHRYLPVLAYRRGFRVTEIPVRHHPRKYGKSKYGLERLTRGFFDLLTVFLLTRHFYSPLMMFGMAGFFSLFAGGGIISFLTILQIRFGSILGHKPLSVLGVLLLLLGVQLISMGVLAEIIAKYAWDKRIVQPSVKRIFHPKKSNPSVFLSAILPIVDETEGLNKRLAILSNFFSNLKKPFEIILVDDGNTDNVYKVLQDVYKDNNNITLVQHRRRYGKASALQSGFEVANGEVIATIEADFQDNTRNILRMLKKIEKGYDFVSGHRTNIPFPRSFISNAFCIFASLVTGIKVPDINGGLKVFKRKILEQVKLYGKLEHFMPTLVAANGFTTTSIEVPYVHRKKEKSEYGWTHLPAALLNILTVTVTTTYLRRPLHLFGNIGILIGAIGFFIDLYLTILRFTTGSIQGHNTLLLLGTTMIIFGVQLWSTGLVAELLNRLFFHDRESP